MREFVLELVFFGIVCGLGIGNYFIAGFVVRINLEQLFMSVRHTEACQYTHLAHGELLGVLEERRLRAHNGFVHVVDI